MGRVTTRAHTRTFDVVGPVAELKREDVVDGAVGVQGVGALVVADVSVVAPQDQNGSVDQLQHELLVLTCTHHATCVLLI